HRQTRVRVHRRAREIVIVADTDQVGVGILIVKERVGKGAVAIVGSPSAGGAGNHAHRECERNHEELFCEQMIPLVWTWPCAEADTPESMDAAGCGSKRRIVLREFCDLPRSQGAAINAEILYQAVEVGVATELGAANPVIGRGRQARGCEEDAGVLPDSGAV